MVVLMGAYLHLYVKARHVGRISGTAAISLVERFETLDAAMRRPSPPRRITPSPRARGRAVSQHRGCNRSASAMGQALAKPDFDRAAYFEWEAGRDDKHEYLAGEVFAMVGARQALPRVRQRHEARDSRRRRGVLPRRDGQLRRGRPPREPRAAFAVPGGRGVERFDRRQRPRREVPRLPRDRGPARLPAGGHRRAPARALHPPERGLAAARNHICAAVGGTRQHRAEAHARRRVRRSRRRPGAAAAATAGRVMLEVLTVFGTRPEAIKMAPLIAELERHPGRIANRNCLTGQHRDMVAPLVDLFGIRVDHDLQLMRENQTLEHITVAVLQEVGAILRGRKVDLLLVQGDTTTSMAAALAAFYAGVKVGHVEAGLRTFDKNQPYPEESNRKIIDAVADLFFAHTALARQHLLAEGIAAGAIEVTGNTVIDALLDVAARPYRFDGTPLAALPFDTRKIVLVTAHRRESFGAPFESLCRGLRELAAKYRDQVVLVYPVHRNPNVRDVVRRVLGGVDNVVLTEPLDYMPLVHLMKRSYLVLTDSGGLQEEAPSLGKPVLVMRNTTERQEGVEAGTVTLVGTAAADIVREASRLIDDAAAYREMANRINPYGDGTASVRITERILRRSEEHTS